MWVVSFYLNFAYLFLRLVTYIQGTRRGGPVAPERGVVGDSLHSPWWHQCVPVDSGSPEQLLRQSFSLPLVRRQTFFTRLGRRDNEKENLIKITWFTPTTSRSK